MARLVWEAETPPPCGLHGPAGTDPDRALVLNDGTSLWSDDMVRPRSKAAPLSRHSV